MSKDIKTYQEMNAKICGLLSLNGDQVSMYAAQRIKELEAENEILRKQLTDSKCIYLSDSEVEEHCVLGPCPQYKTVNDILEENKALRERLGKAIELPCKVGDKVYSISEKDIIEWTIQSINILISNINKSWYIRCSHNIPFNTPVGMQSVRLPANVEAVQEVLKRQKVKCDYEQAERVAWRIIKDWVEAQMAILESEMVTIDEVFMPYMIDSHGSTMYQLFASKVLQISSGQNKVEDEE